MSLDFLDFPGSARLARDHPLDVAGKLADHVSGLTQSALPFGRLLGEHVTLQRATASHLTAPGYGEALCGAAMCLLFGHFSYLLDNSRRGEADRVLYTKIVLFGSSGR